MKLLFTLLAFAVAPLFAQNPCDNPQSTTVAPISITTTGTVTLVQPRGKSVIHMCAIELASVTGASFTITFEATLASVSTAMSGPIMGASYTSGQSYSTGVAGPGATFDLLVASGSAAFGGSIKYYQSAN